jgi:predicted transcriptional regulator
MRIIPIKQHALQNKKVGETAPHNSEALMSQKKSLFYPQQHKSLLAETKSKIISQKKKKSLQKQWKRLKKLNSQYRKKICKQQQLKANINRLQKQILEVKQEIINLHW